VTQQPTILEMVHEGDELEFVIQPIVQPKRGESTNLEAQFLRFHEINPHVYDTVVKITAALKERGFRRAGMKMIFERMRWLWAVQTQGDDYKLNNNYTAFYARRVMSEHPELEGFFETRVQRHGRNDNGDDS
jgi:hypothetical protein